MNRFHVVILSLIFSYVNCGTFDRFTGKKADDALTKELKSKNSFEKCTIEVEPCTPHEGSRIDGSCNSYKYPSRGVARGPYLRLLKPKYEENSTSILKTGKGGPLPSARLVRTSLQSTGRLQDKQGFTAAAAHYLLFIGQDISALNGPLDILSRRHCCVTPEKDARCIPIHVPEDDPYLKVTDIRCLNFSRAETFEDAGCSSNSQAEQINYQTPTIDLSTIYGIDEQALALLRDYKDGLLKLEQKDDKVLPTDNKNKTLNISKTEIKIVQNKKGRDICLQNTSNETTCYQFGYPEQANLDLRTTTLGVFFMREHNRLAKALSELNPCWKDDRLFKVARQINIATAANIFMYELLPSLLGYRNMINFGLISPRMEQVTTYNEDDVPLVYAEFEIAFRFFHTFLDGRIKRYDENYQYTGELSLTETLFKQGLLQQDKVFEEINRGTFFQSAAKIDDIQDPEIAENFYGKLQRAHDLAAMDIQRGRDVGVRGYNEYREICGLKTAVKFEDFLDVMDIEKILILKKLYHHVDDVDLLSGIISENLVKGTYVGPTLFCIMAKQLQLFRYADRFWFERGDQLRSFNLAQLHEIRKTNMARLACDNAEGIRYIQPQAFLHVGHGNLHVPCTHIRGLDLSRWLDTSCSKHAGESVKSKTKTKARGESPPMLMDYSTFFDFLIRKQ